MVARHDHETVQQKGESMVRKSVLGLIGALATLVPMSGAFAATVPPATEWGVSQVNPSAIIDVADSPSTDPFVAPGTTMVSFSTSVGFDGSSGDGMFAPAVFGSGTVVTIDMDLAPGTSGLIGFVNSALGAFESTSLNFGPGTGGGWQQFTITANADGSIPGFEVFSAGGGQLYFDVPVPEPTSLILLGSAVAAVGLLRRRRTW
jgi:hypothetical protein